ncbi:MAG: leucyl/phenylalanyl-tRNA--protein transferase [Saprospiraceae bacterium]|nr:leucyl/phenylalanyl-tRNA--protein transferase [Saprospiraceae bacterium]
MPIYWLSEENLQFPPAELATAEGILAVGGDLSPERLLKAYTKGIFPWFNEGDPITWWSPDPRMVLFPSELKVSKSMRPYFNQGKYELSFDKDFRGVMRNCQQPRSNQYGGTWITNDMVEAYCQLHDLGFAHSVEVWQDDDLVGGLYGVAIGKCFFGESMFSRLSNASKFGFISLVKKLGQLGFWVVDCQQQTQHLGRLGARPIPRADFLAILERNEHEPTLQGNWTWFSERLGMSEIIDG